jgi:hypothetical protein
MNFNQFIPKEDLSEQILLYPITSEDIEDCCAKELTNNQLYRVHMALCCIDSIREKINDAINNAVEMALDDEEPMWQDIDIKYVESKDSNVEKSRV